MIPRTPPSMSDTQPQAPAQAPTTKPQAKPEPGAKPGDDKGKVAKEVTQLVTRGMDLIHDERTRDQIINNLKNAADPVQGVADQAREIISRVDEAARKEGIQLDDNAKLFGGMGIVDNLADLAEKAGVGTLDKDDRELAFGIGMQDFIKQEVNAGRLDPEQVKAGVTQAMQGLSPEQLKEADSTMQRMDGAATRMNDRTTQALNQPAGAPTPPPGPATNQGGGV